MKLLIFDHCQLLREDLKQALKKKISMSVAPVDSKWSMLKRTFAPLVSCANVIKGKKKTKVTKSGTIFFLVRVE